MKNIFLLCIAFITFQAQAQNPREKIKAFKVAHITEQLNLTSEEAQQFWPIYNAHEKKMDQLKKKERSLIRSLKEANNGPDGLSDQQAGKFLDSYLEAEETKSKERRKLIIDLQRILPNKKIIKLIKAESDFNKRLIKRFRDRRMNRQN